jgi:lantibiotic modifying enzyme
LLGDEVLLRQAAALLPRIDPDLSQPHPLDLIGGNAGAIPALLAVSETDGADDDRGAFALATALGDELCTKASRDGDVWWWDPDVAYGPGVAPAPLGGMSHGASGIGLALLSLFARTGRTDFLDAARGAFAFEDSLYCPEARNWRDLRQSQGPPAEPGTARCGRAWCHGAPGIALARLLASELDPDRAESHLETARIGMATTLARMGELRNRRRHDASLCHGLAGLIDVALIAASRVGDAACLERAVALAEGLIERHGGECDYPSGLSSGGRNPSLMLGLAGTGYLFLRLHAPDRVPSVLLPGEGGFTRLVRDQAAGRLKARNPGEPG